MESDKTHTPVSRTERGSCVSFPAILGLGRGVFVRFLAILGLGIGIFAGHPAILGSADASTSTWPSREGLDSSGWNVWFTPGRPRSHLLLRWRLLYQALDHLAALSLEPLPGSERPASKDGSTSSHSTHRAPPVRFDDTA